jgi:hypothetical protein
VGAIAVSFVSSKKRMAWALSAVNLASVFFLFRVRVFDPVSLTGIAVWNKIAYSFGLLVRISSSRKIQKFDRAYA